MKSVNSLRYTTFVLLLSLALSSAYAEGRTSETQATAKTPQTSSSETADPQAPSSEAKALQTSSSEGPSSLRMLCYNTHNCIGLDERLDCKRVARIIRRADAEVVALQELDSAAGRTEGLYVLGELARRTKMHATYAPAIDFDGGKYGVGILSKQAPRWVKQLPLPGKQEARTLLIAGFEGYIFVCTHLSVQEDDQVLSVPIILEALAGYDLPIFLAGDMNAELGSPTQAGLAAEFTTLSDPTQNTFPASGADRCIDFVYQLRNGAPTYTTTSAEVLTRERVASDHLPLVVEIERVEKRTK